MSFGFKAKRLGIEYDLTVTTGSGGIGDVRTVTYTHKQWVKPVGDPAVGTPAASVLLETASGASRALDQWINSYTFNVIRLRYRIGGPGSAGTITFGNAQVFAYGENSDVGTYITSYVYPTSGWIQATGGNGLGNQLITTFRSSNGGVAKVVFMHGIDNPGNTIAMPSTDAGISYFAGFMVAGDSCARALDGGRMVTGMRWNPGQDERWFKNARRPNA